MRFFLTLLTSMLLFIAATQQAYGKTIVVMGDSLSAGYGIPLEKAWVTILNQRLEREHPNWHLVNKSISGETTFGGLSRIDNVLKQYQPGIVIIELGGNDGLRGLPLANSKANLKSMIDKAKATHAKVLLVGIRLPEYYGSRINVELQEMYRDIASETHIKLLPFLLIALENHPEDFQSDGIHPSVAAQPLIASTLYSALKPLL
ncbi:MAG: arylesterase [Pseudomonadota bacterium]|nr:arylesterase [Pseudomonadota bacterium]